MIIVISKVASPGRRANRLRPFGLEYMLPAGAAERNGEIVHVRMSMKRGRRNGQMHELKPGQRALNQLCDTLGRADL